MTRVCFVCLGNICRSPIAEAVMRHLVEEAGLADQFQLDSAGTGAWHVGEPPDARGRAAGARRGITLTGTARRFEPGDFARFDHVVAMDRSNRAALMRLAGDGPELRKVMMLRDFEPGAGLDAQVPDPYYGGDEGFDEVFDICERACRGLLEHLRS